MSNNPLLETTGLPAFDKIKAEHVASAVDAITEEFEKLLAEAEKSTDWDGLKKPMGKLDLMLEYAWSPVGHLSLIHI